jgi:hypothetical protein
MNATNAELLEEIRREQVELHREAKLQALEAWRAFANMGPFDFKTGRTTIRKAGEEAIRRLLPVALRDTGQSGVVAKFLLCLYNSVRFPFDMTELRRLDHELLMDCITLLMTDSMREKEVHQHFENGDKIWEQLAAYWSPIQKQ